MVFCQSHKKKVERSVSLILGTLGNLDHFRHSFLRLYQSVAIKGEFKEKYDNVQLGLLDMLHTQVKQSADVLIVQTVVNNFTVPSGFDNP